MIVTGEHLQAQARRVVTGVGPDGRSCVVSDDFTPHRWPQPGNTMCGIWRVPALPANNQNDDGLEPGRFLGRAPSGGLMHLVVTVPPDSEYDRSQGYHDMKGPSAVPVTDQEIPGLHVTTNSIELITVIDGELVCQLESGDVTLHPGDTLVQLGTAHSWSNRTATTATFVAVMISAHDH